MKAKRNVRAGFAGKKLHLVQFAGPVKPGWLAQLKQNGVQIVSYIHENAYLIYGDTAALARMQALGRNASDFLQWEGDYVHELQIHSDARTFALNNGKVSSDVFEIQLVQYTNSNSGTLALINQLKTSPVKRDYQLATYRNLVVSLPADQLDVIAAQPDVVSIQPFVQPKKRDERQDQIIAGNLNGTVPSGPGYLAWLASKGFTQQQFDDSGFRGRCGRQQELIHGSTTPGHFGLYHLGNRGQFQPRGVLHEWKGR